MVSRMRHLDRQIERILDEDSGEKVEIIVQMHTEPDRYAPASSRHRRSNLSATLIPQSEGSFTS